MRSSRRTARSLVFSLLLHGIALLLLKLTWQPMDVGVSEERIDAELLFFPESQRPTLRRSRVLAVRPTSPSLTAGYPDAPNLPPPAPAGLTRARVRPSPHSRDWSLPILSYADRLNAPEAGGNLHGAPGARTLDKPRRLVGKGIRRASRLGLEGQRRPPQDDVGNALQQIADGLAQMADGRAVDVIFLLDASGSMDPYIAAVARHLEEMAERLAKRKVDAQFGVVAFKRLDRQEQIQTWPLTRDLSALRKAMRSIVCEGDERALDALETTLREYERRKKALHAFILVTNERLTGRRSLGEVIRRCREANVHVSVLGLAVADHQRLARETGGWWFLLPSTDVPEF